MSMSKHLVIALVLAAGLAPRIADAHVSISSGPATANKSQKITFSVGHGCEGADTVGLRVPIPAGVTSVRALVSDFGTPSFERDVDGNVTAVSWRKPNADALEADSGYYEASIRVRVPDAAFTTIYFVVEQTCYSEAGGETTVLWDKLPGEEGNPAAALRVVPARQAGWNSYTLTAAMLEADVATYLGDALIVWKGAAAYSSNPNTMALIAATTGVTQLTGDLAAGDQLWVKY
jgi:uncharacterized protein YcnI